VAFSFDTSRLLLREWTSKDAVFLFELNSDPLVIKYTGNGSFDNIEVARKFIEDYDQYKLNGYGRWLVTEKKTGLPIGWCGLKNQGFIDLGYRFLQSSWGKGYATEASLACLEKGFEHFKLPEIIGRVAIGNYASIRVLEKLGMQYAHTDTCHGLPVKHYKMTSKEWTAMKSKQSIHV
jgi:[ribosomal protein S5]-alanine N-acetyltransferase